MNLGNIKIGLRLGLGFGAVLALLLVLAGISLSRMARIESSIELIVNDSNVKIEAVNGMVDNVRNVAIAVRNLAALTDEQLMAQEAKTITSERASYVKHMEKLTSLVRREEGKRLLAAIAEQRAATIPLVDRATALALANKNEEATQVLMEQVRPVQAKWIAALEEMLRHQGDVARDAARDARESYESARLLTMLLAGGALLTGALVAWRVTRSITLPLAQAVHVAQTVADGDLSSQISVTGKDEMAQLLLALQSMNSSLAGIVGQVRMGTDNISSASGEIATGNLDLSARTEQQASSLEETASSMEELTSAVRQNADNARQANQLAQSASDVAGKGGAVVAEVVQTMDSINASSRKIVDIIAVIDGIAFQTNILALNAAVEAARAGEQGRGFAVVASEVRNLAQRSAAAAKEIKSLIDDSVEKVEAGSTLVDQAGATMQEIVGSIARVTAIMGDISAASAEQTSGIEQVNEAISQMDQVTQQNAALVEEAAAAAQSLQDQASMLAGAVGRFKLAQAGHSASVHPIAAARTGSRAVAPAQPKGRPQQAPARLARGNGTWEEF